MEIRRLEKQDLEYANKLRNEYLDFLRQEIPHNLEQQIKWFESTKDIYWVINDIIKINDLCRYEDNLKGIIGLTSINLKDRKAELSLITEDYLKKEIADFGMDFVEKYAFEKLSLHKLFITVYEFDKKKNNYFKNRYTCQFCIGDDVYYKSEYWGHYYYSFLEDEYEIIKEK